MGDPRTNTVFRRAARLIGRAEPTTGDAVLLDRLVRDRDAAAFGELVTRHGAGVWALCRRLARTEADAEDAFQATFLVLAQSAARVRSAASVGSWLYGVASRITRKARARGDRTLNPSRLRVAPPLDPEADLSWREIRAALDDELARLPDLLRAPILLCYFDGMTQDEAAAELGWNARMVKDRVARARSVLRDRLTRRGIQLPAALAVPLFSAAVASAVPVQLLASLQSVQVDLARGKIVSLSHAVVALARTECPSMTALRLTVLIGSAVGLLAAGSLIGQTPDPLAAPPETIARAAKQTPKPPEADPGLPAGAVRIGTTLFRAKAGWHKRVYFIDDGKTLLSTGDGPSVQYWDVETGKKRHEIAFKGSYQDAAFAPAANLLAIVGVHSPDGSDQKFEAVLWLLDTAARKVIHTISMPGNHGSNHQKVQVSADGKRVFVEYEGDVRVIDVKSGEELMRHRGRINAGAMAASPDGKWIAFGRHDLYLWDWQSGAEPKKFATSGSFGTWGMIFDPDGKTLYVAGFGGSVGVYDVATGRQLRSLDLGEVPWNWSFGPDGNSLAVVYYDSSRIDTRSHAVHVWDPTTGKLLSRFPIGRQTASCASWSADGSRLAAVTDYRVWVWNVKTGQPFGPSATGHEASITGFAFGPYGKLFTASDDYTIRSWDEAGKPGLQLLQDYWVRGIALSPDGSLVAGSALRDDLRVWDAKTGTEKFRLVGNGEMGGTRRVRFTPDGKRLVAWGDDLYLRLWDMRNGKLVSEHRTIPNGMTEADLNDESRRNLLIGFWSADISPDGSALAFTQYRVVQVFDVETGKERMKFEPDSNGVGTLAFSPDGKRLAVAGSGKRSEMRLPNGSTRSSTAPEHQTAVWDLAAREAVWRVTVPGSWAREVRFTDDGARLAEMIDLDKKYAVRVLDAANGKDVGRVELPSRGSHFGFDRTGKRLAVAFWDTTAIVYDLETVLKPVESKK
jgi:RNA polymerase sigma factor (sigma-70 family)